MRFGVLVVTLALAACGAVQRPHPTTGSIAGLARDHDSGDPIEEVEIRVRSPSSPQQALTMTSDRGLYGVAHLPPGRYDLTATFAGQPLDVSNIDVRAGETTNVDLVFTLGRPEPIRVDHANPKTGAIDRYRPRGLADTFAIIEGTVSDTATRLRVAGAVVTAVRGAADRTEQTVSDEQGRYRFDRVDPGIYSVSAYYSISGRGQMEVKRSAIDVRGAEAVVVPLWIETAP